MIARTVQQNAKLEVNDYWQHTLAPRLKESLQQLIRDIETKGNVNHYENDKLSRKVKKLEGRLESINYYRSITFFCILLFIGLIIACIAMIIHSSDEHIKWICGVCIVPLVSVTILVGFKCFQFIFYRGKWEEEINVTKIKAYEMLRTAFSLITSTTFFDIFAKHYEGIKFYPYLSERYYQIWARYWPDAVDESVMSYACGEIFTNPFVLYQTLICEFKENTYLKDGKYDKNSNHAITENSIVVLEPEFSKTTRLMLLTSAAQELKFSNFYALNTIKGKQFTRKVKDWMKYRKGQQEMDNPLFERMFPTTRSSESKFRLLYTPLAQEQTIKLLKCFSDYKIAKDGELNIVESDQLVAANKINVSPSAIKNYSYKTFISNIMNNGMAFYRTLYYLLAPLLCIPLNQQYPFQGKKDYSLKNMMSQFSCQQIIANYFNINLLQHPATNTKCIVNSFCLGYNEDYEINKVLIRSFQKTIVNANVNGTIIPYPSYKDLSNTIYMLNMPNKFNVTEHRINDQERYDLKLLYPEIKIIDGYITNDYISILMKNNIGEIPNHKYKDFFKIFQGKPKK